MKRGGAFLGGWVWEEKELIKKGGGKVVVKILGWVIIACWVIYWIFMLQIFQLPLEIAKDPWVGSGRAIGFLGLLALGIWLVSRRKKDKNEKDSQ